MDRSSKQKISKESLVLNDNLDKLDLLDIFKTFHPNAEEYTFFSMHMEHFQDRSHLGSLIKSQ